MNAHCFIDGGYLLALGKLLGKPLVNPLTLARNITYSEEVQYWRSAVPARNPKDLALEWPIGLARILFYDARPEQSADEAMESYWRAVELLPDVETKFGVLRGGRPRRPPRQKGVDGLIAVDMLVGAFRGLYQVGILIAGDADFVPIVNAVRREGVMVVVAAEEASLADDLRRAADRVWPLDPAKRDADYPVLRGDDNAVWCVDETGKLARVLER